MPLRAREGASVVPAVPSNRTSAPNFDGLEPVSHGAISLVPSGSSGKITTSETFFHQRTLSYLGSRPEGVPMSGTWKTFNVPNTSKGTFNVDVMILLTDGSVLTHNGFVTNVDYANQWLTQFYLW